MGLYESGNPLTADVPQEEEPAVTSVPEASMSTTFEELLVNVMTIREHKRIANRQGQVFAYWGTLLRPAKAIFPELNQAVTAHGYTLYMQKSGDFDEILLIEGVLEARNVRAPWWFHLGLLMATMLTTLVAATLLHGYSVDSIRNAVEQQDWVLLQEMYRSARDFAWPLLIILGVHEMGHYIAARLHGVKVTLPFFIPLPLFGSLGTLGAVIFIKSPFRNRKQLFDVGIAGPLAGLLVAIPIFLIGLEQEAVSLRPHYWLDAGLRRVSVPPFLEFIASFVRDESQLDKLDSNVFYNHPQALAAWFGVLLTSLNLLPMGQFDGGHVAFSLFGRRIAWPLARIIAGGCIALGITGIMGQTNAWAIWLVWPFFAILSGLRHPPPHDDITPLGWPRMALGILTFMLLPMMIVIAPFYAP